MNPLLFSDITDRLAPFSDTPSLDASVLIAHIIKKPRTWVIAHPELTLSPEQQFQLEAALAHLRSGASFPYVLGHWEFFGLDFEITPDVLIPRPETELLVEKAISWLQASATRRTVADVGTGSGAIAISIAINVPEVRVLATDISHNALEAAKRNARKFNVIDRVDFLQCDLLPAREELKVRTFDLICANLPYIPTETLHGLWIFGREPTLALDGGKDGLDIIRRLLNVAPSWLAPDGMLLLEIEATQGLQTLDIAHAMFSEATIHLHQDLAGHDRLLEILLQPYVKTEFLSAASPNAMTRALDILNKGGLVAFPTDTVYGIGSLAFDGRVVESIYQAKDRPIEKAIPVLIGDISDMEKVGTNIPAAAHKLAHRFWPGPLTLLVPKRADLPEAVSTISTVGVRLPDHDVARALLNSAGPMAVTSANISGASSPVTAQEVLAQLGGRVALIIDGGRTPGGVPSTLVDCTTPELKIIREGPITLEELLSTLQASL